VQLSEDQATKEEKPRGKLVIRRRSGQTLVIPDIDVTITFTLEGKQVKLIVEAPKDVVIKRGELLKEKPAETV